MMTVCLFQHRSRLVTPWLAGRFMMMGVADDKRLIMDEVAISKLQSLARYLYGCMEEEGGER